MKKMTLRAGLLVTVLLFSPVRAADPDIGLMLERADALRSSDPTAFKRQLDQIEQVKPRATPSERRQLRLLQAYREVVRGEYDQGIKDATALFEETQEPVIKYRAALLVANTSAVITREFTLALRYLEHALELEERISSRHVRHIGYGAAAAMYNQFGQFALARYYADQILAQDPEPRSRCAARQFRIEALHGLGQLVSDETEIQLAIADCSAQQEPIFANLIRRTLAQRRAGDGQVRQALALLESSLPEVEATRYPRLIGEIHALIADYRLRVGDVDVAEAHARLVRDLAQQDPHSLPLVTVHWVLYQTAKRKGDLAAALDAYQQYAEADKARLDEIQAREYAFQLSRHELAQKNQSIALLSNQNQLLRLQQEVAQKTAWNSRLAIALLAVVALSLGYWGWRGRRMHRTLRQLAQTDSLTGLSNRRHFRSQSEAALASSAQRGRPVSVLLFDLDHFKQINDQCGHAAGDWVLREVARVGRLHCREGDVFGRIGGEEFALTLVDCDLEDAEHVAEQCRRAIAGIDACEAGCTLPVSASIGCVGTSISGYDYEVLVAHADAAMYQSKVGGRNRVSLYQASPAQAMGLSAQVSYEAAATG